MKTGAILAGSAAIAMAAGLFTGLTTAADEQPVHCAMVLKKAPAPGADSEIVSDTCSTNTTELAIATTGMVKLITLWDRPHHKPGMTFTVYGADGDCDHAGYGIRVGHRAINNKTSSFEGYSHCNTVRGFDHGNYTGANKTWSNPGHWGISETISHSSMNDRISSLRVWRKW